MKKILGIVKISFPNCLRSKTSRTNMVAFTKTDWHHILKWAGWSSFKWSSFWYVHKIFLKTDISYLLILSVSGFSPSCPDPGRREENKLKFLFSHYFVVPQKVLWRPFLMQLSKIHLAYQGLRNVSFSKKCLCVLNGWSLWTSIRTKIFFFKLKILFYWEVQLKSIDNWVLS